MAHFREDAAAAAAGARHAAEQDFNLLLESFVIRFPLKLGYFPLLSFDQSILTVLFFVLSLALVLAISHEVAIKLFDFLRKIGRKKLDRYICLP